MKKSGQTSGTLVQFTTSAIVMYANFYAPESLGMIFPSTSYYFPYILGTHEDIDSFAYFELLTSLFWYSLDSVNGIILGDLLLQQRLLAHTGMYMQMVVVEVFSNSFFLLITFQQILFNACSSYLCMTNTYTAGLPADR